MKIPYYYYSLPLFFREDMPPEIIIQNFTELYFHLSSYIERKSPYHLGLICFEEKSSDNEKGGYNSPLSIKYNHFHIVLYSKEFYTFSQVAHFIGKIKQTIFKYLKIKGSPKLSHDIKSLFIKYQGNRRGYKQGCPEAISKHCPKCLKFKCPNNSQTNTDNTQYCTNYITYFDDTYIKNLGTHVAYLKRDKRTGGVKSQLHHIEFFDNLPVNDTPINTTELIATAIEFYIKKTRRDDIIAD